MRKISKYLFVSAFLSATVGVVLAVHGRILANIARSWVDTVIAGDPDSEGLSELAIRNVARGEMFIVNGLCFLVAATLLALIGFALIIKQQNLAIHGPMPHKPPDLKRLRENQAHPVRFPS